MTSVASPRWQRTADRLARYAWLVLLLAVAVALLGGLLYAAGLQAGSEYEGDVECTNPPCFGGGGAPHLSDLPAVIPLLGYLLAIVLALPSLLAGIWDVLRVRWVAGGRRLLLFAGPVLFFVGTEIVPHLLNPCSLASTAEWKEAVEFYCEQSPEFGIDVAGRWHLLHHTVVGAFPLLALCWLALRRWRPDVIQIGRALPGTDA